MEAKRELTSVDLTALVGELSRYEGAKVDKAYLYGEDLLRLKLRDYDRGRIELLIEVGEIKRAHATDPERLPPAPDRPPEFAKTLRARIAGGELAGVEQYEFDRILTFRFERPDAETTVVTELFGDGNVAVLDETGDVQRSLRTVRLKSRTVAPGATYEYPASRIDPLTVDFDGFAARMDESDADVVRTLATQLNFGGLYAEELCTRAGVEKTQAVTDCSDADYRAIYDEIDRLAERLGSGELDPHLYTDDGAIDVTPLPLEERASFDAETFSDFNAAVDEYFHRLDADESDEDAGSNRPDFESEIAKYQRIIDQQQGAIENFDQQADTERRRGELLYAHYDLVDEILRTVRQAREAGQSWDAIEATLAEGAEQGIAAAAAVDGVNPDTGELTVRLGEDDLAVPVDPSEGVERNADRRYQEAKRVESKKSGAQEAIADTRADLERVKQRKAEWEAGGHPEQADDEPEPEPDDRDWLARSSVSVRQEDHWYESFRWFYTSDGFLVIGGRDADTNEQLVKKYMDGADLFFHSQAHGGPVTVLKATAPSEPARDVTIPDRSRREAAQFAVAYSSVWKDGRGAGDAYMVQPDQVSKTPESGEYLEKGGFAIRGDRTYFRDLAARVAVGVEVAEETRVIGGPPDPIREQAETTITLQPGQFAQNDAAVKCYREFKSRFTDESFVRKVASADEIQNFLPPGNSDLLDVN